MVRGAENSTVYLFDGFRLDVGKRLLHGPDGNPVALKAKAFDTLLFLVENAGRVIERDELLSALWPDTVVEENNLTQHISSLRRVFGEKPDDHRFIATVAGRGYMFVADVNRGPESHTPENPRPGSRRWILALSIVCIGVLLPLVVAVYKYRDETNGGRRINSIAVLPFNSISRQEIDSSMELGMTQDLITKLAGADGLKVRPLSAVMRYGSLEQDVIEAGRALNVDVVLACTMQRSADKVRLSVVLTSVADSKQLWAERFNEALTDDILTVQDLLSERVANRLAVQLSANAKKRYTDNVPAYEHYLLGRMHQFRLRGKDVNQAIADYQKAIDLDPNYALAYTGISDCYRTLVLSSEQSPAETIERAIQAGEKAVTLDPELTEAQTNLGFNYFWFKRDWVASETAFKRAIEIDPNSALAHHHYSHLLSNLGRHDEAIAEAEKVRRLDSYTPFFFTIQGLVYHQAGRFDEALSRLKEATGEEPDVLWLPEFFTSVVYVDMRRYEEALELARKASEHNPAQSISLAYESVALARLGRHAEANKVLDTLLEPSEKRHVPPYHIAITYMGLGDRENALNLLEKSFVEGDPKIVFLKTDRIWDNIRSEPRFIELMKKMKLEQ